MYTDVIDCIGHNISFYYITYLFTAVLGLHCCAGQAFLYLQPVGATLWLQRLASQWLLSPRSSGARACRLQRLQLADSGVQAQLLWRMDSVAASHVPCAIFPDQGLNMCLLLWQVDFFYH